MITRRNLLLAAAAPRGRKKPNVVFILTDDQGYGDLSIHGNTRLQTPHIDSLARDGVRFTNFHSSPVCSPTRSSLLTGRYNYRTGVVDTYLGRSMMHADEVTIAEMLKPAGYRTGIFGKWHLGDNYPLRAMDQGFDESLVLNGGGLTQPGDAPEALTGVKPSYFDPLLSRNGKWEAQKGYCTDVFFREAMRFIDAHKQDPFFCYIATNAPHDPLQVAPDLVRPYLKLGLDDQTAKTYAMIANIDENTGKLLGYLKSTGLERDTMVVFMTDNGPQRPRFNAGLKNVKGSAYEGGIKVPFFIRWPARIPAGTLDNRIAAHIDFTPTILAATGAKTKARMDGRDLFSPARPDRTIFLQWHRGDVPEAFKNSAVLTQRYKLVDGKELYDLEGDPGEAKDLAAAEPAIVNKLRRQYDAWFQDVSATRNFAHPRIALSDKAPVLLTRQDWRGPRASWDSKGEGYWDLDVRNTGAYEVTLLFEAPATPQTLTATWLGEHPVAAGQSRIDIKNIRVPLGPQRFEAAVAGHGIQYAYFRIPAAAHSALAPDVPSVPASMQAP